MNFLNFENLCKEPQEEFEYGDAKLAHNIMIFFSFERVLVVVEDW